MSKVIQLFKIQDLRNKILVVAFLLTAFFVGSNFLFLTNVNAEEILDFSLAFEMPGKIEGTGTHFEITNSEYLNITLNSSESIKLRMESIPEMVTMMIEPSDSSTISTQITLSGLTPLTKYYKYQDDYHNLTEFITDENGKYTYIQDLSKAHFVFIQPRASTKFIKDDATGGDCASIGIWDNATKTCTLTQDIYETIQIDSNYITIDGNGHLVKGNNTGFGVYIYYRSNITIKNLSISYFTEGIKIYRSDYNNLINNIISNNDSGLTSFSSSFNKITENLISNNRNGILIWGWPYPPIVYSQNNLISKNVINFHNYYGIYLSYGENGTNIVDNTISNNLYQGIYLYLTRNIKVYNNNFINNFGGSHQVFNIYGSGNIFNLNPPIGGNYWSPFIGNCADKNLDGFCDGTYPIVGDVINYDYLPWVKQDGWKVPANQPPVIFNLNQYKSDGITPITEGSATTESSIVFKVTLNDPDNDQVKLQVELKEFGQPFNEQDLLESDFVNSGSETIIAKYGLIPASYHWRARAIDDKGNAGDWQEFGTAGNVDFEVKLVPLYTQVRSPFPSETDTARWAVLDYGTGYYSDCLTKKNPNDPNDPTMYSNIARCGCAITSMVMLGKYYNINVGIDNTNTDPSNINTWLSNNSGYTKNGSLWWGKTIEYLGFVENGVKKVRLSLDYFNATSILPIVDNYITSAKPVVAYSSKFGHYFIVDDKLQNTYTLKDPRWYNTKKLNDSENLANEVRGYNNYFDTANLFRYLETPKKLTASIYLYLSSPAEFLITDPLGRKLGKDPILDIAYSEIPDGSYTQEGPIITSDTPLDQNQIHKTKVIYIPTPIEGNYDIRVIGTDTGRYELNAFTYDNQGESHTQIQTGNTQTDLNIDYNLNFTPDAPENITIQPEDVEAPIISYTLLNSQYVLNSTPTIFNFSAQDSGVGVYTISATLDGSPITNGQSISFEQLGSHEIKITAEDFVGNTTTETINFDVIYNFSGFLSPIKTDGTGIYKLGRTLPTKFRLKDANGVFISNSVAQLFVAKISDGVVGIDEIPLSTSNVDTGNIFRYDPDNNQFIYNLSTNALSVGSWQLKVILDDGKYYTVVISIK